MYALRYTPMESIMQQTLQAVQHAIQTGLNTIKVCGKTLSLEWLHDAEYRLLSLDGYEALRFTYNGKQAILA